MGKYYQGQWTFVLALLKMDFIYSSSVTKLLKFLEPGSEMLGEFNHYVNDKVKRKKRTVSLYTVPNQICKKRGYKYFSALRWTQIISLM